MKEREIVLVVGSGAREHAIGWKIKKDNPDVELFFAPGNGGTEDIGTNLDIGANDINKLSSHAKDLKIDLTIVGPERPLKYGIVDAFHEDGLEIFGHTQRAAVLETDKAEAVLFMRRHNIPHPDSRIFTDPDEAIAFVRNPPWPLVVKAAGLAEGKGVDLPDTYNEAVQSIREKMVDGKFGEEGKKIVIQKRLKGREISLIGFISNEVGLLVPAKDYKRAFDGDRGPNTGGMGAYAPNEHATRDFVEIARDKIIYPTFDGAINDGFPLVGPFYASLMDDEEEGLNVIEYNMRFGDPETQVQLRLLKSNLLESMRACTRGELEPRHYRSSKKVAVGVVVAADGYPNKYNKGMEIGGFDELPKDIVVFHAGTTRNEEGQLVTNGGRILTVTATGETIQEARGKIYSIDPDQNSINETFMRHDIAI